MVGFVPRTIGRKRASEWHGFAQEPPPARAVGQAKGTTRMRIHIGCEMTFDFPQETPMIAMLNVHYSRASDLERPDFS